MKEVYIKHMNETYRDNCTVKTIANKKEEINMINTGMYKNYGLLEDEAQGTEDIDEFVFQKNHPKKVFQLDFL